MGATTRPATLDHGTTDASNDDVGRIVTIVLIVLLGGFAAIADVAPTAPVSIAFVSPSGRVAPITTPPPIPPSHEARTSAPSAEHVWLDGQLWWNGRGYVWLGGTWAIPPRNDAQWEPSRWVSTGDRYQLEPGHWVSESIVERTGPADPIRVGITAIFALGPEDERETPALRHHDFVLYLHANESVSAVATLEPSTPMPDGFDWDVELLHRGVPVAHGDVGAGSGEREIAWTAPDDDLYVFRVLARGALAPVPFQFAAYPGGDRGRY